MKNDIGLLKNIILRIMATFAASGLGVIGAGTQQWLKVLLEHF